MKHGTLLVVDDNRNILTTVKMVTEQTGCVRTSPMWCCSI